MKVLSLPCKRLDLRVAEVLNNGGPGSSWGLKLSVLKYYFGAKYIHSQIKCFKKDIWKHKAVPDRYLLRFRLGATTVRVLLKVTAGSWHFGWPNAWFDCMWYLLPNNRNEQPAKAVNSDIQCLLYDGCTCRWILLVKNGGKYIIRDF